MEIAGRYHGEVVMVHGCDAVSGKDKDRRFPGGHVHFCRTRLSRVASFTLQLPRYHAHNTAPLVDMLEDLGGPRPGNLDKEWYLWKAHDI
jgi:hypothetical protein